MQERPSRHGWRELRDQAGLSVRGLSARCGISIAVISQIETGRMVPSAAEAEAILRVLRPDRRPVDLEAAS